MDPRTMRTWWPVPALGLLVGVVLVATDQQAVDLAVYRLGGETARLAGWQLYDVGEQATGLPFTYPPVSALLMVPVSLLSPGVAVVAWTAVSVVALAVSVRVALRAAGHACGPGPVVALSAGSLALEPVWSTLGFGQVNLVLLALLLLDLLVVRGRARGVLTGVAAAVKLTPLVFVVFLLLTGRVRAAATAGAAFVAAHLVGALVLPTASAAYFSGVAVDAGRVGGVAYSSNQSVLGVLTRLLGRDPGTLAWLLVAGPVAVAVLLLAVRLWRTDALLGTSVAGLSMLLASPISWSHHWVWCLPLGVALWRRSRGWALAWAAVFASTCVFRVPNTGDRELAWTWWEQVVGNAYLEAALAVCAGLALVARRSDHPIGAIPAGGHAVRVSSLE